MTVDRSRWRPWVTLACTGALLAGIAPGAGAVPFAPEGPSDEDVRAAQQAVVAASSSVASMEVRLAQLGVELDDAWVAVERAGEDYTEALVARDAALSQARTTSRQLEEAETELAAARARLVAIALKAMRSGSSSDQLRAVLEAGGIEDLVEQSEAMTLLGARTNEVVQNFRAASLVASTLRERATKALAAHEQAALDAEQALATAQDVQSEVEAKVEAAATEREQLLVTLAAARQTSVELERERQDRLDQERRERERREREREREEQEDRDRDPGEDDPDPDPGAPGDPRPDPSPDPRPDPSPDPRPDPSPDPRPDPSPDPRPDPRPDPSPSPTPKPEKPKDPKPKNDPYGLGTGTSVGSASQGKAAVKWAKKQEGVEYVYGGTGDPGFDCSGLTMKAWADAGVALNRSSRDQYRQVLKIKHSEVRPGDLFFWGDNAKENDPASVTHVAMYIGDNKIIEAPRPGLTVRIIELDGWRMDRIMPFAGRP